MSVWETGRIPFSERALKPNLHSFLRAGGKEPIARVVILPRKRQSSPRRNCCDDDGNEKINKITIRSLRTFSAGRFAVWLTWSAHDSCVSDHDSCVSDTEWNRRGRHSCFTCPRAACVAHYECNSRGDCVHIQRKSRTYNRS